MKKIAVKDKFINFCEVELHNYEIGYGAYGEDNRERCIIFYGLLGTSHKNVIARIFDTEINLYDKDWLEFFEVIVGKYERYNNIQEITIYYWEHYMPLG